MSAVLNHAPAHTDVGARLAFQKQLQAVTNKIHATSNIDEIMLEVSADVCGCSTPIASPSTRWARTSSPSSPR